MAQRKAEILLETQILQYLGSQHTCKVNGGRCVFSHKCLTSDEIKMAAGICWWPPSLLDQTAANCQYFLQTMMYPQSSMNWEIPQDNIAPVIAAWEPDAILQIHTCWAQWTRYFPHTEAKLEIIFVQSHSSLHVATHRREEIYSGPWKKDSVLGSHFLGQVV